MKQFIKKILLCHRNRSDGIVSVAVFSLSCSFQSQSQSQPAGRQTGIDNPKPTTYNLEPTTQNQPSRQVFQK